MLIRIQLITSMRIRVLNLFFANLDPGPKHCFQERLLSYTGTPSEEVDSKILTPRIRIRTKISWIRNKTAKTGAYLGFCQGDAQHIFG
jgi:hypothetical protein